MPKIILSLRENELAKLPRSESKPLFILCFNVGHFDTRYHGKGIASAMVTFLKNWARERDWEGIEALSCPDVVPFHALGPQHLRRSRLESHGFRVISEKRVALGEAAIRRNSIEDIISGSLDEKHWMVRSYPGNVEMVRQLTLDSSWSETYDKEHVMGCDL